MDSNLYSFQVGSITNATDILRNDLNKNRDEGITTSSEDVASQNLLSQSASQQSLACLDSTTADVTPTNGYLSSSQPIISDDKLPSEDKLGDDLNSCNAGGGWEDLATSIDVDNNKPVNNSSIIDFVAAPNINLSQKLSADVGSIKVSDTAFVMMSGSTSTATGSTDKVQDSTATVTGSTHVVSDTTAMVSDNYTKTSGTTAMMSDTHAIVVATETTTHTPPVLDDTAVGVATNTPVSISDATILSALLSQKDPTDVANNSDKQFGVSDSCFVSLGSVIQKQPKVTDIAHRVFEIPRKSAMQTSSESPISTRETSYESSTVSTRQTSSDSSLSSKVEADSIFDNKNFPLHPFAVNHNRKMSTESLDSDDSVDWDLSGNIEYYDFEEQGKVQLKQAVSSDLEKITAKNVKRSFTKLNPKRKFSEIDNEHNSVNKTPITSSPVQKCKLNFSSSNSDMFSSSRTSSIPPSARRSRSNIQRVRDGVLLALGARKRQQEHLDAAREKATANKLRLLQNIQQQIAIIKRSYDLGPLP